MERHQVLSRGELCTREASPMGLLRQQIVWSFHIRNMTDTFLSNIVSIHVHNIIHFSPPSINTMNSRVLCYKMLQPVTSWHQGCGFWSPSETRAIKIHAWAPSNCWGDCVAEPYGGYIGMGPYTQDTNTWRVNMSTFLVSMQHQALSFTGIKGCMHVPKQVYI